MEESADTKTGLRRAAPSSDALGVADTEGSDPRPLGDSREVADRYGRYVVLGRLGAGGMGEVFAAWDPELDRRVALKRLQVDSDKRGHRARLLREAQAMARLRHPNVVAVHDVGSREGEVFIAMEYVEGQTLRAWAKPERPWREVVGVHVQAARGLAAAHAVGLVHRDFKPDNAMIDGEGRVQVLDFGLVAAIGEVSEERSGRPGDDDPLTTPLTATGTVMGTPAYMAPEAHRGRTADARSDQFALSVALYEALHGHRPFAGATYVVLRERVLRGKVEPESDRPMPAWLRQVVRRGLATDPDERYASMDELIAALEQDPERVRRRRVVASMGALTIASAMGAAWWAQGAPERRCADAAAPVAEVWSAPRQAALKNAFDATELSFAAENWTAAQAVLDGRTRALEDAYVEACRATHVERIQSEAALDQRRLCLDRQVGRLDALLDVLADADEAVVSNAVSAVETFDDPSQCTAERAILGSGEADAPASEAADALRKELHRADALRLAGKHGDAYDTAQTVVSMARELDDRRLLARALAVAARCAREDHALSEADAFVHEAHVLARELNDDAALFEALLQRIDLAQQRDRHEQALRILEVTRADAKRAGRTDLEPGLDGREGLIQHGLGHYREAVQAYERALLGYRQRGAENSVAAINAQGNLATSLSALGEIDRGIEIQREVVDAYTQRFGKDHPLAAAAYLNLGAFLTTKEPERALELTRKAVAIREAALGFEHPLTAEAHERLGSVLLRLGKVDEAEVIYRDAVERMSKAYGDDQRVSLTLNNLAGALWYQNKVDDAIVALERSLEIKLEGLPADHPDLLLTRANLGLMHTAANNTDEALLYWEVVLKTAEAVGNGEEVGRARVFIAYNLARSGDKARARAVLAQAGGAQSVPKRAQSIAHATQAVLETDPERAAELARKAVARSADRERWLRDQMQALTGEAAP